MRIITLLLSLSLGCNTEDPKPESAETRAPNIIVFTLDTLRADALGSYGNKAKPSPNIDALAGQTQ